VDFAGGNYVSARKLKSKNGWKEFDFSEESPKSPKCKWKVMSVDGIIERNVCNTDEYRFSALPGGSGYSDGSFNAVGNVGYWWSSSRESSSSAWSRYMFYDDNYVYWGDYGKSHLFSVRCVKD